VKKRPSNIHTGQGLVGLSGQEFALSMTAGERLAAGVASWQMET